MEHGKYYNHGYMLIEEKYANETPEEHVYVEQAYAMFMFIEQPPSNGRDWIN